MDFDRMINPLDVQAGLDELPGFVPNTEYLHLKSACWKAYEAMNIKRIHRYSMEELKSIVDAFSDLAQQANASLRHYAANECFVFLYSDFCERYAELESYQLKIRDFLDTCSQTDHVTPTLFFGQWKRVYSAIYENTYFVEEFLRFRDTYENVREIAWFLEFDSRRANRAIGEFADYQKAGELLPIYWRYRYGELFDRIGELFTFDYIHWAPVKDYLELSGFKVAKSEVRTLLQFYNLMTDFEYQMLKSHIQIDR